MLKNKNVLVTGATRGIGKAIAIKMAQEGANIGVVGSSSFEKAEIVCDEIRKLGVEAKAYICDVSKFEETEKLAKEVIKDFGKLDVIVNNAGITKDGLMLTMKEEDFDRVIDVNLKGNFNIVKSFTRHLFKNRSGNIVNITSVSGLMGNPGQSNYAAAKAGVVGMTKTWAKEFATRNIRVNAVAPGFIETDMTKEINEKAGDKIVETIPMKRLGKPEDIAEMVTFLASDKASYITGEIIKVDGGIYV